MDQIPIEVGGRQVSHLAVWLEQPAEPCDDGTLAVLYVHGFGSYQSGQKATFFRRRMLAHGIAFCSFDFQGHGESGGSLFDLSMSRNLSDIGRVHGYLRARGYERIILMGSSMGGGSALWYAALHPQDIVAGVHLAASVSLHENLLRTLSPEEVRRWERDGKMWFTSELVDCEISWNLIEDLRSFQLERLRSLYRTPTLLIHGQQDDTVPWRQVIDFATECEYDELEVHLFADGDHRLIDRLEHLGKLMLGFLSARGIVPEAAP
ncbi:MAG: alpha/beta hydrolase [bacterium]|nr:alpha/beta hydrolase [bacterium]